jgi:predicted DNA-binding protein
MSRPTRYSYSMTLRLEPSMESELENLAYDRNVSKAGFIRRCIGQAIADAHQHGTSTKHSQAQRGAL